MHGSVLGGWVTPARFHGGVLRSGFARGSLHEVSEGGVPHKLPTVCRDGGGFFGVGCRKLSKGVLWEVLGGSPQCLWVVWAVPLGAVSITPRAASGGLCGHLGGSASVWGHVSRDTGQHGGAHGDRKRKWLHGGTAGQLRRWWGPGTWGALRGPGIVRRGGGALEGLRDVWGILRGNSGVAGEGCGE